MRVSSSGEPSGEHEQVLKAGGFLAVAGVDEAGRGSLAGPIVAAAVILEEKRQYEGLRDSKKLTPKRRCELFDRITVNCVSWSVSTIEPDEIDRIGLGRANILVLEYAVESLTKTPDYVLADWYKNDGYRLPWAGIRGGDRSVASIAAASIIAKVTRDRLMTELAGLFPGYGFEKHKGYGSAEHLAAINALGPSPVHRMSFKPCSTRCM